MADLMLRNLELFFRDKTAVILSLLAEVIIMMLYIIFMRDNLISSFTYMADEGIIAEITDIWMMAGILELTPLTAAMGAYGVMIEDRASMKLRDMDISPVRDVSLVGGYIMFAAITGIIMSMAVLLMSEIYMLCRHQSLIGRGNMPEIYIMLVIESICCGIMAMVPAMLLKTSNALAGFCTVLGALSGFLTGIYLPIGSVEDGVGMLVKAFPVSHGVVIFRRLLAEGKIYDAFSEEGVADEFMEYMGIIFTWKGHQLSYDDSIFFLIAFSAMCLSVIFLYRRWRQRFGKFRRPR